MKHWYTHLIEIESVIIELDKMDLSKGEKLHLAYLIDSSLHHTILNAVFSELNDSDKRQFANHLADGNHDKIWHFLNEKVKDIENKIQQAAQDLKQKLTKDLKEAKNLT